MKSSSRQRRIRPLKAKAATADSAAEFDSYGAEPNMKLSHAFMVVLALHVVAVGGLFAFNKVKAGHSKVSEKLQTEVAAGQAAVASEEGKPLVPAAVHEVLSQSEQHPREGSNPATVDTAPTSTGSLNNGGAVPASTKKIAAVPKILAAPVVPTTTATKSAFLATKTTGTPIAPTTVVPVTSS